MNAGYLMRLWFDWCVAILKKKIICNSISFHRRFKSKCSATKIILNCKLHKNKIKNCATKQHLKCVVFNDSHKIPIKHYYKLHSHPVMIGLVFPMMIKTSRILHAVKMILFENLQFPRIRNDWFHFVFFFIFDECIVLEFNKENHLLRSAIIYRFKSKRPH